MKVCKKRKCGIENYMQQSGVSECFQFDEPSPTDDEIVQNTVCPLNNETEHGNNNDIDVP